ncbi:hypothetical protein RB1937 [Rhodopirellula baltica SH 1]|uniref:Uncharacterized protein n=1 Tax=Rhodopirellula baltica (strain DSM 10527 / NCIMB 13988 / SH1) TaxID=243090 RepID=Q7UWL8_RHOBA|nr:hypothetical protein RB1937 [Rhodopirellula baltica SH 1]
MNSCPQLFRESFRDFQSMAILNPTTKKARGISPRAFF